MFTEVKTDAAVSGEQLLAGLQARFNLSGGMGNTLNGTSPAECHFDIAPGTLSTLMDVLRDSLEADFTVTVHHWQDS